MAAFQQQPATASSGAPGAGAAGAGDGKKLTWSERQALAKKQQEEEDASSAAAGERAAAPAAPAPPSAPTPPPFINVTSRPSAVPSAPAATGAIAGALEADSLASQEKEEDASQAAQMEKLKLAEEEAHEAAAVPRPIEESAAPGTGKKARVLFAYEAEEENELTLREGEVVMDVEMVDEGWWSGTVDGRSGLYPSEHINDRCRNRLTRN